MGAKTFALNLLPDEKLRHNLSWVFFTGQTFKYDSTLSSYLCEENYDFFMKANLSV